MRGQPPGETDDPVTEVARRLRAERISAQQAIELLIDATIERQSGGALAAELKDLLRRQAETDPYLLEKVRRLERDE